MGNADSTQMEKVNEVLKASKKLTLSTKGDIDSFDFRVQTVIVELSKESLTCMT
jgi:hypothetical protein